MKSVITTLSGQTVAEIATLATERINSGEDLSAIAFDNVVLILETANIVKRRKLSHVGGYLAWGQAVNEATTMPMIIVHLSTPLLLWQTMQRPRGILCYHQTHQGGLFVSV